MTRRKTKKVKSQAQAGLFGAVIAGKQTKAKSLTQKKAKEKLRGVKVKKLPKKVGK